MKTIEAAPRASTLIESMRDIGYTLETALADVIDNSITAGAQTIRIFAESRRDACIAILDDGSGMSHDELIEAMRPGSRSPLEERGSTDLGRFGLGLKTASFSQCRRMTVVTRFDNQTSAAIWDLDRVAEMDEWLVQIPERTDEIPYADLLQERGTLVLWEKLDRLVGDEHDADRADFNRRLDEARQHLELVFHRFLAAEPGKRKISILLNERLLEPFDPFNSRHPATIIEPPEPETLKVANDWVRLQTFTLPHHSKVSQADWERYGGREGYVKNQGFYLYRERRLIIHGTWFGLARQTELTKLTRVRIDMPNGLDADWKIDVRKASAQPPYVVRQRLRKLIETIGATSKGVYRGRGTRLISENKLPVWNRLQDKGEIRYQINPDHPILAGFMTRLSMNQKSEFLQIIEVAAASLPFDALLADLNTEPEKVGGHDLSDDALVDAVRATVDVLSKRGIAPVDVFDILRRADPFKSNWTRAESLIEREFEGAAS